ncbi:chitobiase/beta-hexosaminidase C-terminal domain-containing protein [Akkermansiaceae bacterium]|nr:chitobiase/beta-hexosaminidase C-terminal domain-containing protein [Akkermansiaceae bacterium]
MEVFFEVPSPGEANSGPTFIGKVDAPDFDNKGGFYDNAVTVTLTSMTAGASIRYTTDGSEPTLDNGIDYSTPLNLGVVTTKKGHVIRARAYAADLTPSNVKTHTFLIGQDARLRTSPSLIYAGEPERSLYDPFGVMAINGGAYSSSQWSPTGIGDYNNVINRGRPYERPIHAEFYFADGTVGFRSEVGLRVASSSYSRPRMTLNQSTASPWPASPVEKPSFNLYFRDDYGNPSVSLPLNGPARGVSNYQRFRIRAGKNDILNPYVIDELIRRLSHEMGNGASIGVINSLYVNGELKGFYNMVERLREPLFQSLYSQDQDAQWDVLQFEGNDNVAEGDRIAWEDMITRLNAPINVANWERVLEVADVANMADYYLLNIYGATWDWPHNNWAAAKERSPEGRYRLHVWDAEGAMANRGGRVASTNMIATYILGTGNGQGGQTGTEGELRDLWRGLNRWEDFRIVFADRIHKHLFNGGVLDDRDYGNSVIKEEFDGLVDEFSNLLSVMNGQTVQTSKVTAWTSNTNGRRSYLLGPNREEFRDYDLWPTTQPPEFSKLGGNLALGETLKITNSSGEIYYTTDGSDPRDIGGQANSNATSQAGSLLNVSLIPIESEWKYNDTDGDQGVAWRSMGFDDELWPSGAGPLGYGSVKDNSFSPLLTIPIATTINTPFAIRQPSTYFRKTFEVENAGTVITLSAKIRADAGSIVYLNGIQVFYDTNIPANATYATIPTSDASDGNEGDLDEYAFDANLLIDGMNTIAVQLLNPVGSSDMVFDLQLDATTTNPNNPPVIIDGPTTVMARSLDNGVWSALTEASFTVNTVPADSANLAVVEMLYNPVGPSVNEMNAGFDDGDLFEYLRVQNIGSSTVSLEDVRFTEGIGFDYTDSQIKAIPPNGIAIIVSNLDAFRERYGTVYDQFIAGEYSSQLSNGGEQVRILGINEALIHEFEYETTTPWPDLATLDGHSIQINDSAGSHNDGSNWRASSNIGGVPDGQVTFALWQQGEFTEAERNNPAISGMEADPDGDGSNNLLEFALGSSPTDVLSEPVGVTGSVETIGNDRHLVLSYTRTAGVRAVNFLSELSDDLQNWSGGGIPTGSEIFNPDGTITAKLRHPTPITDEIDEKRFMRLLVTPTE